MIHHMVITEIQEIESALQEFREAVQPGETVGDVGRGMIKGIEPRLDDFTPSLALVVASYLWACPT